MHGPATILLAAAFTIAVAVALGLLLLRSLGLKLGRGEEEPAAFLTGAACLSLAIFLLAALRIACTGVFASLGVLVLAAAAWRGVWPRVFIAGNGRGAARVPQQYAGGLRRMLSRYMARLGGTGDGSGPPASRDSGNSQTVCGTSDPPDAGEPEPPLATPALAAAPGSTASGRPREATDCHAPVSSAPGRPWRFLFIGLFTAFFCLYLVNAMAPEKSADGAAYHLGLIARYHRAHGFEAVTTNIYAMLPQGVEMLFWFAFAFGGHSAAALVHLAFAVALVLAMLAWARRFGTAVAGAAGALFVFLSPVAGIDSSVAYIDMAVAAGVFVLFHLLRLWEEDCNPRMLIPIGLLAGFCYAMKYTAFPAVLYALAAVGWKLRRNPARLSRAVAVTAACAALMMVPWLAKNAIVAGNPFAPFLNALFPNPYVHVSFETEYREHMRHYEGLTGWGAIPLEVTVRGRVLCGLLGPLFLLAPVALLALRTREGRRLLLAWAVFAATYLTNVGTRFLLPSLPFLALAMALALTRRPRLLAALAVAHAVSAVPPAMKFYADPHAWRLNSIPLRAALRLDPEDTWLRRHFPEYSVARLIEREVPPSGAVFSFNQVAEAYTSRRILVAYESALGQVLGGILWTPAIPDYQPVRHVEFPLDIGPHRKIRVVQTAEAGTDPWVVTEMRFFLQGRELPRSPDWRVRAWPNVWDSPLAFDGSPVTVWSTWQPAWPFMSIEADFGEPVRADAVRLDCPRGQTGIRLRAETQEAGGRWLYQSAPPAETAVAPPAGLRRYVAREFLDRGVTHLLVQDSDFFAGDFRKNASEWRLAPAGDLPGVRLYRFLP